MTTLKYPFLLLAITVGISSIAQKSTQPIAPKKETKTITIRSKSGAPEKMEVTVDGEKITVNGKPLSDLDNMDISIHMNDTSIKHSVHEMMRGLAPLMQRGGHLNGHPRAFLGVVTEKDEKGARIISIEKGSAAEKAGLKNDDIITQVNTESIVSPDKLAGSIGKLKPEDKATIHYLRDGKKMTMELVLGKAPVAEERELVIRKGRELPGVPIPPMPEWEGKFNEFPKIEGLFNFPQRPKIGMEISDLAEGKGVKVVNVLPASAAAKSGLQKDDVVTELNGKLLEGVDHAKEILRELKEGEMVKLAYTRNGKTQVAEIKLPRRIKTAEL